MNMKFVRTWAMLALVMVIGLSVTGGTIAWFTDSVTSSANVIQAGNLDVELYHQSKDVPTSTKVEESTELFTLPALWEPGAVAWENLTVKNAGDLALKYEMSINATDENTVTTDGKEYGLSSALKIAVVEGGVTATERDGVISAVEEWKPFSEFVATGKLLPKDSELVVEGADKESKIYGVVIYWEPSVNDDNWNVNNDKTTSNNADHLSIKLGINLEASQLMAEEDSFDNEYDKDGELVSVNTSAAITNNNGKLGEAVVLTADMPYGTMTVTVPAGAQLSSTKVSSLKLTVKNAESNYGGQLAANQVATGYEIYVDGIADYLNPFVNAVGNKLYNYSDITVELPISAGRNDVKAYQNGMMPTTTWASYDSAAGIVTFSVDYFTPFSQQKKSNITVVYTKLSAAENQLNEALGNATAGDSVSINSTADNMVSVNNIADALNGSSDITLVGSGADKTTVASNGATVTADSLTVKDMTIQSVGTTTIKGNNTTIEGVKYQSLGASYGLTVSGSDTTIRDTTVEGANATQGLVVITADSDTTTSVTNVSDLTITDISPFGASSGFTFRNINGTVNLSDSTIKVGGAAFGFGPSNSTVRGNVNVSNTTFDSTSASISTVKASTFDNVTFENTWNNSAITFTVGGQTNTFTDCEFKADVDFQSANYAGKNVTLTFNNCEYDGAAITAENIKAHFVFNNGTFGLQNRDNLTVIVNGTTVAL